MDHHRRDDILSKKHRRHEDSSCEWSEEEMLDHFRSGLADRDSLSLVRYHTIANADPHERSLEPYKSSSSKKYGYSVPPLSDFDPAFRLSDSASKSHTPHRSHTSLDPLPYSYYPTLDQYYSSSGHNYRTVSANNHWPVATQRSRAEDSRVHVRMDSLELRSPDGARVRGTGVNINMDQEAFKDCVQLMYSPYSGKERLPDEYSYRSSHAYRSGRSKKRYM